MSPSPEDRMTALLLEVEALRSDLAEVRAQRKNHGVAHQRKSAKVWLLAPVLVGSAWMLSAQTPASNSADIEKRVSALEGLIRKGPGNTTQVTAPFEVIGPNGRAIVRVQNGQPSAPAAVVIWHAPNRPGGNVTIHSDNGRMLGGVATSPEGFGVAWTSDAKGIFRASLHGEGGVLLFNESAKQVAAMVEDQGRGRIAIWSKGGTSKVVSLDVDAEHGDAGVVTVLNPAGKVLAMMGARTQGGSAGTVSVMNASGTPVAGLTGGQAGGGAVVVTNSGGVGLAEMSVSSDGRGLFQVFGRGGRPVAVLTQAKESPGGLLQISNTGTPVANITVGLHGGGYFQLTNASGLPTIEAGTRQDGRGQVRAGPLYKCSPVQIATTGMQAGFTDCLMGAVK